MKTPPESIITTLLQHSMFENIDDATKKSLIQDINICDIHKKSHLIYCGTPLTHYYFLASGVVQLYRPTLDGEEKIFYLLKDNEIFFAAEVFSKHPITPFSVLALQPSVILQLSSERLLNAINTCPQLSLNLLTQFSSRYYQAINRIDILTISNASQRFVLYLFDLAKTYNSMVFNLPLTQKNLAKQLNIAPETLSRIISQLCATGFLQYTHSTFHITQPNQLKTHVGLPVSTCCCQTSYSSFN